MRVMNDERLREILIRAGRSESTGAAVPTGFEARVMRAVRAVRPEDPLEAWASGLWRAALSSVGVAAVVGAAALFLGVFSEPPSGGLGGGWAFQGDVWNGAGDELALGSIDDSSIDDSLIDDPWGDGPSIDELKSGDLW